MSEIERESMPVDVLFVGGGPACLAGAIHLMDLIAKHNEGVASGAIQGAALSEPTIALIEKGSEIGSHAVSGAVLDPRALAEIIPDWAAREDFPLERYVERESMLLLTETKGFPAPLMPPEFKDHGKPIISIAKFQKWMAGIAEEKGVMIFPGFAGVELLYDADGKVSGVRTGDKGIDAHGEPKDNFEPGMLLESKVTIIGEGPRGHLARQLMKKYGLQEGRNEMAYEMGCKEVLEFPPGTIKDGFVYLTAGYPLGETFGGAFIYSMGGDRACIGLLAVLDAKDPRPRRALPPPEAQDAPQHPGDLGQGQGHQVRRQGRHRGRLGLYAQALRPGRDVGRRHGLVPQRRAHQGHPPRDEVGHVGGGDGL